MSWKTVLDSAAITPEATSGGDLQDNRPNGHLYPLDGFRMLAITGPDRFSFLQGQVTCDMDRIAQGEALLGAHLNLQGRIEAGFVIFPENDRLLLLLPVNQVDHLKALLQKYILFAQAEFAAADDLLPYLYWAKTETDEDQGYQLPNSSNVYLHYGDQALVAALLPKHPIGTEDHALAIMDRNGFLLIDDSMRGKFLPQELNYDQIDGISFNKGCYKGQEVVARIHFKGQVKQRLQCFSCAADIAVGSPLVDDNNNKVGEVVHSIAFNKGSIGCILCKVSLSESISPCLEQNDGPELKLLTLPYAIT